MSEKINLRAKSRLATIFAATLVVGFIDAGCSGEAKPGASDGGSVAGAELIASSVDVAAQIETMRVKGEFSVTTSGDSMKAPLEVEVDFKNNAARITTSLDELGIPGLDDTKVEMRLIGSTLYVRVGDLIGGLGSALLGGKEWLSMDVAGDGGASLAQANPAKLLATLRGIADVKEVGNESINGVETMHYTGRISLSKAFGAAPSDEQSELRSALRDLADEFPVDVWVDGEGRTVRLSSEGGGSKNRFSFSLNFSDFGADLNISAPPASDVGSLGDLASNGNS